MTAVLTFGGISFLLNGLTVAISFGAFTLLTLSCVLPARRRVASASLFALSAIVAVVFVAANSVLAAPATWQVTYAAIKDAPPEQAVERSKDIKTHWVRVHDEILVRDWYALARRWGVCHELWPQDNCTHVPAEREAMGIARERLSQVANGA